MMEGLLSVVKKIQLKAIVTDKKSMRTEQIVKVSQQIAIMPAYKTNGKPLVYFAGYKKHIGFYATPTGHSEFQKDLSKFKQGKGSVRFPIDKPISKITNPPCVPPFVKGGVRKY